MKAIVSAEEFDALSGELQNEYTQNDDGTYLLNVSAVGGWSLEDVAGLKRVISETKSRLQKASESLKAFEGIDPDQAREALSKLADIDSWDADKKKAEIEEQLRKKFDRDVETQGKKLQAEIDELKKLAESKGQRLSSILVDQRLTDEIIALGGGKKAEIIKRSIRPDLRLSSRDGADVVEVVDGDGNPRLSPKSGSTELMTIAERVAEFRDEQGGDILFDATSAQGGGAQGSEGAAGTGKHIISREDARDLSKYKAASEAAEKAGRELVIKE